MEIDSEKQAFIDGQVFQMTLAASTQRGDVYEADKPEAERAAVHEALRQALEELAPSYRPAVSDSQHCTNIEQLAARVSDRCGPLLRDGKFRIGTAQKALNLYLKYLWCLGRCDEPPPHCPFDALVLQKVPGLENERWTKLTSIERYRAWVDAARKEATAKGFRSLAHWELHLYNEILAHR